jgi:hypothetical protein
MIPIVAQNHIFAFAAAVGRIGRTGAIERVAVDQPGKRFEPHHRGQLCMIRLMELRDPLLDLRPGRFATGLEHLAAEIIGQGHDAFGVILVGAAIEIDHQAAPSSGNDTERRQIRENFAGAEILRLSDFMVGQCDGRAVCRPGSDCRSGVSRG